MAPQIIVFFWPGSPWSSKVVNYLSLRGIPYTECHQPIVMPRPILDDLGVKYRRVPLCAIGKDIYCDSLLILEKLEEFFPTEGNRVIAAQSTNDRALVKLLEKWTDAVVFKPAADVIPLDHPLVTDPGFIKDRTDLWGEDWAQDERAKKRAEGLAQMRAFFDFLENGLLADGREWILGGKDISVADIQSAWIFNWLLTLNSFPEDMVSEKTFPKVLAWCKRYDDTVNEAVKAAKPEVIEGDEVLKRLASASFAENVHGIDSSEPLDLKEGQEVTLAPTDTGFTRPEKGPLVAITKDQIVVGTKTKDGTELRIHTPRWNFKVKAA